MRKGIGCVVSIIVFFVAFVFMMVLHESSGARPGSPNPIGVVVAGVIGYGAYRLIANGTNNRTYEEEDKK